MRQFDIDAELYDGIHVFLSFFDACYAKMATEIPCESIGKAAQRILKFCEGLDRRRLMEKWIIQCNGPELSDAYPLLDIASDDILVHHRAPIIPNSKFDVGAVIDRLSAKQSKLDWH